MNKGNLAESVFKALGDPYFGKCNGRPQQPIPSGVQLSPIRCQGPEGHILCHDIVVHVMPVTFRFDTSVDPPSATVVDPLK